MVEHDLAKVGVAGSSPVFRSQRQAVVDDYVVNAQVAELVDALVSGASGFAVVQVRVLFWAPTLSFCADGEIGRHATLRG